MDSVGVMDRRGRARAVIRRLAIERGHPDDLRVLSERWNTVVALGESGVIAKAATLADLARSDPEFWFQQEVDVCRALSAIGAPVHSPLPDQQPVTTIDGIATTLWHAVDGEMGECTEQQMVESLAELHRLGSDISLDLPWFATLTTHFDDVMPKLRDRGTIPADMMDAIEGNATSSLDAIQKADLPGGFIHGDAQRKNAMRTDTGSVWIDLEECSIGPYAWDIACLTMNRRFDEQRVLDHYRKLTGVTLATPAQMTILKRLRDLEGLTWMLAIQDEREPAFREEAVELLASVLQQINAG